MAGKARAAAAAAEPEAERLRSSKLRKAYGAATQQLREKYPDEFKALYVACAAQEGVDYHPRLTAEQRAAEQFDALLAEHPFLADRLANPNPDAVADDVPVQDEG